MLQGMGPPTLDADEVAFVICVEANQLAPQARLLCESLRRFGGRYRSAEVIAISPRPALAIDCETRAALEALGVSCVVEPLNETGSPYGPINRIVASAWAEAFVARPYLVVLDTDTLFVAEPELLRADAGVRPVDIKGAASSGPGDPQDRYWTELCRLARFEIGRLPRLVTTIDRVPIRASYNGGFAVVRRDLGILTETREIFFAAWAENLRPRPNAELEVFASTGFVGREASEWWGSSQAALAVAIWSVTTDVLTYDERYNIPLNNLATPDRSWPTAPGFEPILLHYHHLAEASYRDQLLGVLRKIACPAEAVEWLESRLSDFDV